MQDLRLRDIVQQNFRRIAIWKIAVVVTLLPAAFFPNSVDVNIFSRAADCINNGGRMYVDFIDIKPPLLYDIFAAIRLIVGRSEIALHLVDVALHLCILFAISIALYRRTGDHRVAFVSTWLYALLSTCIGPASVLQAEGLALAFLALILALESKVSSTSVWRDSMVIGFSCAILVGLKLSFAVVIPAVLLLELTARRDKRRIQMSRIAIILISALVSSIVIWRSMFDMDVRDSFTLLLQYIRAYAASPALDMTFVRTAWKSVARFFADGLSISLTLCAVAGIRIFSGSAYKEHRQVFIVSSVMLIFLGVSVLLERKFHPYHFVRLFLPISVLSSAGVLRFVMSVREKHQAGIERWVGLTFVVLFLVMSPLPRYVALLQPAMLRMTQHEAFEQYYQNSAMPGMQRLDQQRIANMVREQRQPHEKLLVIAVDALRINELCDEPCWSHFAGSQFYFAVQTPAPWLERFHDEFFKSDWLVVSTADCYPFVNLQPRTSMQSVTADSVIASTFRREFRLVMRTATLDLYHREHRTLNAPINN